MSILVSANKLPFRNVVASPNKDAEAVPITGGLVPNVPFSQEAPVKAVPVLVIVPKHAKVQLNEEQWELLRKFVSSNPKLAKKKMAQTLKAESLHNFTVKSLEGFISSIAVFAQTKGWSLAPSASGASAAIAQPSSVEVAEPPVGIEVDAELGDWDRESQFNPGHHRWCFRH